MSNSCHVVMIMLKSSRACQTWKDTLVKAQIDHVLLLDGSVKDAFHIAMRSQGFFDVPYATLLGGKLDWLEVFDILRMEEHVPNHG